MEGKRQMDREDNICDFPKRESCSNDPCRVNGFAGQERINVRRDGMDKIKVSTIEAFPFKTHVSMECQQSSNSHSALLFYCYGVKNWKRQPGLLTLFTLKSCLGYLPPRFLTLSQFHLFVFRIRHCLETRKSHVGNLSPAL